MQEPQTHAFLSDWGELGHTAAIGVLAYAALVVMLRVAGKRTLVKLNVFDFAGVVALGSALATTILSPDVSLLQGLVGIGAIVAAQSTLAVLVNRLGWLERIVNGEPTLLIRRGRLLAEALRQEKVTEEEVRAALRGKGVAALEDVEALVLETDGTFSLIHRRPGEKAWTLGDVPGAGRGKQGEEKGEDAEDDEDETDDE